MDWPSPGKRSNQGAQGHSKYSINLGIKLCIVMVWYIGHRADCYGARGIGKRLLVMGTSVEGAKQSFYDQTEKGL